jgi:hypothetical protein
MNEKKKELFERAFKLNRQIYHSKSVPGEVYDAYMSALTEIENNGWLDDYLAWKAEQPEEEEDDEDDND